MEDEWSGKMLIGAFEDAYVLIDQEFSELLQSQSCFMTNNMAFKK